MHKKIKNPVEFLMTHIEIASNGCWVWTGNIAPNGYGRLVINKKYEYAHRFSYKYFKGEIPEGLHLDHKCRNRACSNPEHLEPVTLVENILRGYTARLDNRTHCVNGHELTDQTSFINKSNRKSCLTCKKDGWAKAHQIKKDQNLAKYGLYCPFCKGDEKKLTNHMGHHTKPTEQLKPKSRGNTTYKCLFCGKDFQGHGSTRKYCSLDCAYASPARVVTKKEQTA